METVQLNSVTVGTNRIVSAGSDSASHHWFHIGADKAFSGKRVVVTTAIVQRLRASLAVASARQTNFNPIDNISHTSIRNFPGEPYAVRSPIPVSIERIDEGDYLASFEEANIASSGITFQEAYQNLAIELLNIFEKFTEEKNNLGPEPTRQLNILRRYLVRRR